MHDMKMLKSKAPFPRRGTFYDFSFKHVNGGVDLRALRKRPKPVYALFWFGGFKFKLIKMFRDLTAKDGVVNPSLYKATLNFDPELLKNI